MGCASSDGGGGEAGDRRGVQGWHGAGGIRICQSRVAVLRLDADINVEARKPL